MQVVPPPRHPLSSPRKIWHHRINQRCKRSFSPGALVFWVNFEISLFPAKMGAKQPLCRTQHLQMPIFQQNSGRINMFCMLMAHRGTPCLCEKLNGTVWGGPCVRMTSLWSIKHAGLQRMELHPYTFSWSVSRHLPPLYWFAGPIYYCIIQSCVFAGRLCGGHTAVDVWTCRQLDRPSYDWSDLSCQHFSK